MLCQVILCLMFLGNLPVKCFGFNSLQVLRYQDLYHEPDEDYELAYGAFKTNQNRITSTTPTEMSFEAQEKIRKRIWLDCLDDTGVEPELVVFLKNGGMDAWQLRKNQLREWTLCVLQKKGLMTQNGVFLMDNARIRLKNLHPELRREAEEIIDRCLTSSAIPPRDIAWYYLKCLYQIGRKRFPTLGLN